MPEHMTDIEVIGLTDTAEALGVPVSRIHQHLRNGILLAVRQDDGTRGVPAAFVQDATIVKGLPGVITLLRDGGYADDEIVAWLFREDDSLPGTPIQALRENRGTEVKRRAQVAAF